MVFVIFGITASLVIISSIFLSHYADIIDKRSNIKGLFISLLVGGATSLPEVITSISAIVIGNPDLAAGNKIGSNLFNVLILATVDIGFRNRQMYNHASKDNKLSLVLGVILSLFVAIFLMTPIPIPIFNVGLDSVLLILLYVIGIKLVSKYAYSKNHNIEEYVYSSRASYQLVIRENDSTSKIFYEEDIKKTRKDTTLSRAVFGFTLSVMLVLIFGTILTITADKIAVITGLGSTFIGSFLLGASTSLPELVSVINAARLRNYELAIGTIVGSNTFNVLILAGTDFIYLEGPLLANISFEHLYTVLSSMILMLICLYAFCRKKAQNSFTYMIPSISIIIVYFIASYMMYIFSIG